MLRPDEQAEVDVDAEYDRFCEWLEDRHMTWEEFIDQLPIITTPEAQ